MTTILKEIEITGKSLMKNRQSCVRVLPSNEGFIRFFVENSLEPIVANVDNVVSTNHCITLGIKRNKIMLTEHFMAACAFCGINSIDVHISKPEIPILDGSAKKWVALFNEAGIEKVKKKEFYTVSEPVYYINGKTHLIILPDEELSITYAVNYDHPDLKNKWISLDKKNLNEIIEARTFGFLKDLKKFQLFGFARGVTYENTVGLDGEGYTTELRSEFEPIKHKILDLIGDLYLTGVNPLDLKAQIIVKEAGHAVHVKAAKMLKEKMRGKK
ncbi:MAG: UDP-3-O-acyl-N-acetylglucosamine deacetylase [Candidatus Gastranaerophilales bacterium]|nr:UDP-3-O-acyl-N-acetylglucosamine deacetylase [Candidatus Gastranaerophilales bacterium]